MKTIASVKLSEIKKQYKKLGTDISRLVVGVEEFELIEDSNGLRTWSPSITGDSQFYSELAKNNSWYYMSDKKEFDVAYEFIGNKSVLEVGCGEGHFAEKRNISSYVGLELNSTAVDKAHAKNLNVILKDFKEYASENPSSTANVCSFQLLEHLPDPTAYFQSAHQVLESGGLLITSVPSENSFAGTIYNNCLNAPPHHITRWTDKCLEKLPSQYGFECVKIIHIPVEEMHYKWFWSKLIEKAMKPEDSEPSIATKLKARIVLKVLNSFGITCYVPESFCIPGHTILAVHKKL